jgi:ribulose-phosphate 3-epimerase
VSPGVAINPGTSLSSLDEAVRFVDFVLVMSVNPGWGGQSFIPGALERVARLRETIVAASSAATIAVDGGVGEANAGALAAAGASHLVAGASVFGGGDVPAALARLARAAHSERGA